MRWLWLGIFVSGCTMSVQPFPAQVSRQELAQAFKQRDDALEVLTTAVRKLMAMEKKETAPK